MIRIVDENGGGLGNQAMATGAIIVLNRFATRAVNTVNTVR